MLLLASCVAGCAAQQPYVVAPQIAGTPQVADGLDVRRMIACSPMRNDVHALPYQGRLVDGDPAELPPAVAKALSKMRR